MTSQEILGIRSFDDVQRLDLKNYSVAYFCDYHYNGQDVIAFETLSKNPISIEGKDYIVFNIKIHPLANDINAVSWNVKPV